MSFAQDHAVLQDIELVLRQRQADAFPHSVFREFPRELAERVQTVRPDLWRRWRFGERSPEVVEWATRRREAYARRHRNDFRAGGVIAAIKWGVVLPIGVPAMLRAIGVGA